MLHAWLESEEREGLWPKQRERLRAGATGRKDSYGFWV